MAEAKASPIAETSDREIVVSRVFDAPRELVWEAWTNPKHVVNWWGPRGFTTTIHEMDVRPGGAWLLTMHGPDGTDYPNHSVFLEVVKPERIVFSHGGGRQGEKEDAQFEATWTFEAQVGNKTKLTIRMLFPSAAARDLVVKKYGAIEGANQTLGRLAEHLKKISENSDVSTGPRDCELLLTRVFNAPREVVFKAWTDPKQVAQWWGPRGFTAPVCELDVRPGGAMRVHMRGPDGVVYPMTGTYREILAPERLVFVSGALDEEGNPLFEVLSTVTLTEQNGKTLLTLEARVVKSTPKATSHLAGMEVGWTQTIDRLAEHLAKTTTSETPARAEAYQSAGTTETPEFTISRIFDAPRELVWRAFTERERIAQWWGPKGFTWVSSTLDLRPGGVFHYCMRAPNGMEMWGKFVYREIVAPERVVFVNSFSDKDGNLTRHFASATWPLEVLNVMTLTENGGKTTLTLKGHPINASELEQKTYFAGYPSMQQGFKGAMDQLADYLATL